MSVPETVDRPSVPTLVLEEVYGELPDDRSWRRFGRVRVTRARGDIVFEPAEAAAVGFCIRLRDRHGDLFGREACWRAGEHGPQTLATVVLAGTRFTFEGRRNDQEARFVGTLTMS